MRASVPATGDDPDRVDAGRPVVRRRRRRSTATSNFGVGRRESHDAGAFYARFHPPEISDDAELHRPRAVDRVWCHDAADMDPFVADASVALVVTSPPYFAGKTYEEALGHGHVPADYQAYRSMLFDVFAQCRAKLEPGGRIAVNVANLGRKPYRSLSADVIDIFEQLGLLLRGEVIWRKSQAAGGSCAWGTYQRPGNPVLRDVTERIVIASKGRFDRAVSAAARRAAGWPHEGSLTADDFVDATTDVWDIAPESATRVGHPAPFPVEVPGRLIELFTYRGDLVLDPFIGSGTTAVAAVRAERHYAGFDVDPTYVELAERRIAAEIECRTSANGHLPRVVVPAVADGAAVTADDVSRAVSAGAGIREVARVALVAAGFTDVVERARLADLGVDASLRALDRHGGVWLFDIYGARSITRPGLKRADTVWRAIGKAAVLDAARRRDPGRDDVGPLVLLSTDRPPRHSATGRALAAMTGPGQPVHDVIELLDDECLPRLRALAAGGRPVPST